MKNRTNKNPFAGNSHFGDGLEIPAKKQLKTITKSSPEMTKFITWIEDTLDELHG